MPPRALVFRGRGALFSTVWHVVGFVQVAKKNGQVPIVDLKTSEALNSWVGKTPRNSWTQYFEPVSDGKLEDHLATGDFSVFDRRPIEFPVEEYSADHNYRELFHQVIQLSDRAKAYVEPWLEMLSESGHVLGVHLRGTDMRIAKSHLAPPTARQYFITVDEALERGPFDSIFLASEDERLVSQAIRRYGKRIVLSDSFRTRRARKITRSSSAVLQWRYLLGFQVIRDAWMLSRCHGLVSGHSNVSEHAQVLRDDAFSVNLQIRRPRVDVLGSSVPAIRATNLLRKMTVARYEGPDFKVVDRSANPFELAPRRRLNRKSLNHPERLGLF